MSEQSEDSANLELLRDALILERRSNVKNWVGRGSLPNEAAEIGELIRSIQASLEVLETVMTNERLASGKPSFVG